MNTFTGSGSSDPMPNGTQSTFNVNVPGALLANVIGVNVTNAASFPANVIIVQETLIADGVVEIVLENQSGSSIPAQVVDVLVITT